MAAVRMNVTHRLLESGFGRKAGRFPCDDATGQMGIVTVSPLLRRERSGYRPFARAAGKTHSLPPENGNAGRMESRERHTDRAGIAPPMGSPRPARAHRLNP